MSDTYDLDAGPDPADLAAADPESDAVSGTAPVYAVGIGPGNPEYLTPRGERAIRDADVVVGFESVVGYVRDVTDATLLTCGYADESATLDRFADQIASGAVGTAVLMGDPNHSGYQFVGKVTAAVPGPVRIIPGISSLQIAASRARTPMEETTFVTLHRSGDVTPGLDRLRTDVCDRHLLVLPRPFDWMPEDVARDLMDAGAPASLDAIVFERLTHEDEATTRSTLGELASHAGGTDATDSGADATDTSTDATGSRFSDLSVLAVRRE